MAKVYLGLGSNIDPEYNLRLGLRALESRFGELEKSGVYQSAALGFEGDDFLNMAVGFDSDADPVDINDAIERIHQLAGRRRSEREFSARPLDIDLLLYGELVQDEPGLRLPRADVLEYSFVLRPLAEIAPDLIHPATGQTIQAHWQAFDHGRHPLTPVDVIL